MVNKYKYERVKTLKISVILGHPYEKSFNHAIAQTVLEKLTQNGHEVFYHDLYKEKFDPIITGKELVENISDDKLVEKHCSEIKEADGIVIIHPNWWGQPPAILKGWIDRVLQPKVAYDFSENDTGGGVPDGLLRAKMAIVFNTSNTPEKREMEVFGDPLETIWKNCVFDFCGVKNFYRKMYRVIADSTYDQRQKWLEEVGETIGKYFPKE